MPLTPDERVAIEEMFDEVTNIVGEEADDDEPTARSVLREAFDTPSGGVEALPQDEPFRVYNKSRTELASIPPAYSSAYAVDASTTRPESYTNGLTIDVANAKAAMLGDGDADIERYATIVGAYYINNDEIDPSERTLRDDQITSKLLSIEPSSSESIRQQVSNKARTMAEGSHAESIAPHLDGPLFLDGSIYPMSVLTTLLFAKERAFKGDVDLTSSAGKSREQDIVDSYVHAIDSQFDNGYPVVGVVKTMTTDVLVSAIEEKLRYHDEDRNIPWTRDDQLLSKALYDPDPDAVTFTSWMVETQLNQNTGGNDDVEPLEGFDIANDRTPQEYRRAWFYVRLPSTKTVFRVEAPLMMVYDKDDRQEIQLMVIRRMVEAGGTPAVVDRADTHAHISQDNSKDLKRQLAKHIKRVHGYNRDGRFETISYHNHHTQEDQL